MARNGGPYAVNGRERVGANPDFWFATLRLCGTASPAIQHQVTSAWLVQPG